MTDASARRATGVWLIGARGNVATLATVGARAVGRGLTPQTWVVTAREPLAGLDLPTVEDLVFGGHDVRRGSLVASARRHRERNGIPDGDVLASVEEDLAAIDNRIRQGTAIDTGAVVTEHADAHGEGGLQAHLASFFEAPLSVDEHDLSRHLLEANAERHRPDRTLRRGA